jgi:hypothetical protein
MARLAGLGIDHHTLPPDRHLATGAGISWPALGPSTRTVAVNLLTTSFQRKDNP